MPKTVLVVEDERGIRKVISDYLLKEGFCVLEAADGNEALAIIEEKEFDLAVLDVMLPFVDGWTLCRRIKETKSIPVLFLTARGAEYDEIMGFEVGADDYIKKPFSPTVLMIRIKKMLEIKTEVKQNDQMIEKDVLKIDKKGMKVWLENKVVELTNKEFQILTYLVENEGCVLSRERILTEVWGYDYIGEDRVVDNHIKKIRKNMGNYAYMIRTVFGVGYIFEI
ncbi:MAG: response regulator transcription factor [Cellulosilyticaceae bacterium]